METKGVARLVGKMPDWPISRQNVWGIKMPIWYKVDNPEAFLVWFFDNDGVRQHGPLSTFLAKGYALEDIVSNLQQVYAPENCEWTLDPSDDALYMPETDTFDTWFSSAAWRAYMYGPLASQNRDINYPSDSLIIGSDLLRIAVARQIVISAYLTNKLPFKSIYFHPLILGADEQKMSKSLGNSVSLDEYVKTFGADVTRMALVSYLGTAEDFVFEFARLEEYKEFTNDLWRIARAYNVILAHGVTVKDAGRLVDQDYQVLRSIESLSKSVGFDVERHFFTRAQEKVTNLLPEIENLALRVIDTGNISTAAAFLKLWPKFLVLLHPFAPHITEAIHQEMKDTTGLLSQKKIKP